MLLAIDTCGLTSSVALGEVPGSLWTRELPGKTASEGLLAVVHDLLREAETPLSGLSGLVVVNGPGSFTGIRIGVSAAKGLAEALSLPVIAISRLELLARQTGRSSVATVLDAGRGEFFVGIFRDGAAASEYLLTRDLLPEVVGELALFACEDRVAAALADLRAELIPAPGAAEAWKLGMERFRDGSFDDVSALDGNYLRRSETEMLARIAEHAARAAGGGAATSR
jgi:tRNA threonylcarbamoyladenosine biosynthesis protein TsaB